MALSLPLWQEVFHESPYFLKAEREKVLLCLEVLTLCLHHHFLQHINKRAVAARLTNGLPAISWCCALPTVLCPPRCVFYGLKSHLIEKSSNRSCALTYSFMEMWAHIHRRLLCILKRTHSFIYPSLYRHLEQTCPVPGVSQDVLS